MKIFYKDGFYFEGINTNIPENAVEITEELHKKLYEDMSNGYALATDENGYPYTTLDLKSIQEQEIQKVKDWFDFVVTTPVQYTNGLWYEPEYSQQYYTLLQKYLDDNMTLTIWDVSGKPENAREMTKQELIELTKFLADIYERAYQEKKSILAKIKVING